MIIPKPDTETPAENSNIRTQNNVSPPVLATLLQ